MLFLRSRRKLSSKQKVIRKVIICILVLSLAIVVFFELTVRDRLELVIISEIETVAHTAINDAVNDYIKDNTHVCNNLISITKNTDNNINSIRENTYNTNLFKTEITQKAQNYVEKKMLVDGIDVKLGNFSGLVILSEVGPYIHFNIESSPTVSCEILSSFESAGVNQTLHHIELEVYVDIYVGNPIRIESICFDTNYEIAQTVIVGNIPSAYGSISRY